MLESLRPVSRPSRRPRVRLASRVAFVLLACLATSQVARAELTLPQEAQVREVHPGVRYFRIEYAEGPQVISGIIWDRRRQDLMLRTITSGARGLRTVPDHVETVRGPGSNPIAAFNGDFYIVSGDFAGTTIGAEVADGKLLRFSPNRPAVMALRPGFADSDGQPLAIGELKTEASLTSRNGASIDITTINRELGENGLALYTPEWGEGTGAPEGAVEIVLQPLGDAAQPAPALNGRWTLRLAEAPRNGGNTAIPRDGFVVSASGENAAALGTLRQGDALSLRIRTAPPFSEAVEQVVGGGPTLVTNGEIIFKGGPNEPAHPRTAIGFDQDQAVLLVVDGRQPGYSFGVTLPELAQFMRNLGCNEALNLDGGGSSTCWVRGEVMNSPSDGGPRRVANGLALISLADPGEPAQIAFERPSPLRLAVGASAELSPTVTDERLNPVDAEAPLQLRFSGPAARVEGRTLVATGPGSGSVMAQSGAVRGELEVEIVEQPAALAVTPARVNLLPGASTTLTIEGRDAQGHPVLLGPAQVTAASGGQAVEVDDQRITGKQAGGSGELVVSVHGLERRVPFSVAAAVTVENFAQPAGRFASTPDGLDGEVVHMAPESGAGGHDGAAMLEWAFGEMSRVKAAYLRLNEPFAGQPLRLAARVRSAGVDARPMRVLLKVALIDGNSSRHLYTLHDGEIPLEWTTYDVDLPPGLKQPLVWQDLYVVRTNESQAAAGAIVVDELQAYSVGSSQ